MKNIILAALFAAFLSTPAHADVLGDFIHRIAGSAAVSSQNHHEGRVQQHRHIQRRPIGSASIHSLVNEVAALHHVRPSLVHAVVRMESGYNCSASNHLAKGIMQVKQATAASVGIHGNLHDCRTGLEAGVRYLKESISKYGDGCVAYSAYNSGIGAARCTGYGRRLLAMSRG